MEPQPHDDSTLPAIDTPESELDSLRSHPEWDAGRREAVLTRLIARYPPERLRTVVRSRLGDLYGADAEPVLRLVEALADPSTLDALAEALLAQSDLPPERAWEALALLDDAGRLERYPELDERWQELSETIDEDGSLDQLASQIEDDPEGLWLALQGLAAVEPEIRTQIIVGLTQIAVEPGPNMIEFLRLLSFAHDPASRTAALDALDGVPFEHDAPRMVAAWASVAADHPDPEVALRARRWLSRHERGVSSGASPLARMIPRLVRSLVSAIDGQGLATIVLSSTSGSMRSSSAFLCDVSGGIREVFGQDAAEGPAADAFLDEIAAEAKVEIVLDRHPLAEALLRGCLLLCGPNTTPALRYWLERTLGPHVVPQPFPFPFPDWDPASVIPSEMAERAGLVLESCPGWVDVSDLTHDMAEEILLREGDAPPDPIRDAGAYRYLFEHQLGKQLELYRRMLLWMASFWQASGDHERGRSAVALAWQLSDEQNAVPRHPFFVGLTTRSFASAQANLRAGVDPRRPPRSPGD